MGTIFRQRALRYRELAQAVSDETARNAILELAREYERRSRSPAAAIEGAPAESDLSPAKLAEGAASSVS
jgi:hypothetical protein